jgi:hypothetical protein
MSHHGRNPFDGEDGPGFQRRQKMMRDLLTTAAEFRGAMGEFPQGKLTPQDEGAIRFAVGEQGGKVVIDFGTAVHWFAMTAQEAADLASILLSKARLVGRKNGETITLTIGK